MKDDRGELDLTRQIDDLKSKIKVYESDLFNSKKLRFKIKQLESNIIEKDNLIDGMRKIIDDLSIEV
tara:strand:+ start:60 stop:260 length:201 start_codon:yes stop_codon:yes gene_type:complete